MKKKMPYRIATIAKKFDSIKKSKRYHLLSSGDILAFLMQRNNKLELLVKEGKNILTTDFALYEAIGSARGNIEVPLDRLKMLLWNVIIVPEEKKELTRERMGEIRREYGGM